MPVSTNKIKYIAFSYVLDGKTYHAWPANEETLARLHKDGKIKMLNGICTCGDPDFCDSFTHRKVRCMSVTSEQCELFETTEVCND